MDKSFAKKNIWKSGKIMRMNFSSEFLITVIQKIITMLFGKSIFFTASF